MRTSTPLTLLCFSFLMLASGLGQTQPSAVQTPATVAPPPQEKSLADMARDANKNKAPHAKTVFSNDNLTPADKSPLPPLAFETPDNSEDVWAAMKSYCADHNTKECETLVHDWYSRYFDTFMSAVESGNAIAARVQYRSENGYNYNPNKDPQQNWKLQAAEAKLTRDDQSKLAQYRMTLSRIQQAMMKIRMNLNVMGKQWAWFKIPYPNGNTF